MPQWFPACLAPQTAGQAVYPRPRAIILSRTNRPAPPMACMRRPCMRRREGCMSGDIKAWEAFTGKLAPPRRPFRRPLAVTTRYDGGFSRTAQEAGSERGTSRSRHFRSAPRGGAQRARGVLMVVECECGHVFVTLPTQFPNPMPQRARDFNSRARKSKLFTSATGCGG